jgi:hypothetical protein
MRIPTYIAHPWAYDAPKEALNQAKVAGTSGSITPLVEQMRIPTYIAHPWHMMLHGRR